MNIAIRYFTKSKKGNTAKLAEAVSEALGVEAKDISASLEERADRLFLINAMYAFDIDPQLKEYLKANRENIGLVINMCTSASGKSTHDAVKKVTDELGIELSQKDFACRGSWIFINKGLPSEEDFKRAAEFAKEAAEQ